MVALIYEAIYDNKYGIALAEWVGVYLIIFFIQSFADDLKHFEVTIDDEGFKVNEFKSKIGYAAEYCKESENGEEADGYPEVRSSVELSNRGGDASYSVNNMISNNVELSLNKEF